MTPASPAEDSARDQAELFVLSGPDVGRSFAVAHGSTVGRAPDRDVVLRDRSISRHHAHFELAEGAWSIVDDGSTNGFTVGGVRQPRAELAHLADFSIGEVLVRLRTAPLEAQPAPKPAPPPAPRAPAPLVEDELEIDAAPEDLVPTRVQPAPAPAPGASQSPERAARPLAAGAPAARGQRVLQFHRQEARTGLFVTDLGQRPWWVRALALLAVLAVAALLAWAVYRGVLSLREDLGRAAD